jgi:hypothetical protein
MARGQLVDDGPEEKPAVAEIDEALAALGLRREGELNLDDVFYLWPENEMPFGFWCSIQTQWITDQGFKTGLNYQNVEVCMRLRGIKRRAREKLFMQMQMLEQVALEEFSKK